MWRSHIFLAVEFSSRKNLVVFDEYSDNSILGGVLRPLKCQLCTRLFGLLSRASKVKCELDLTLGRIKRILKAAEFNRWTTNKVSLGKRFSVEEEERSMGTHIGF